MGYLPPSSIRPKNSGTKKIFHQPLLEKLTRTNIYIPISIFLIIAAGLLYFAIVHTHLSLVAIPFLFLAGWLFFTFLEYIAHRYLFHLNADTPWKRKMQYHLHGVHHEYPKDKDRLAMPPPMSILLAGIFFIIFYTLIDTQAFAFLPGMLTGYAMYLFVHYIVHAYPPPQNPLKQLWVNHAIHHYKDSNLVFGVSSPLWDYVFGTLPSKKF